MDYLVQGRNTVTILKHLKGQVPRVVRSEYTIRASDPGNTWLQITEFRANTRKSKLVNSWTSTGGPSKQAVNLKGLHQTWTINETELIVYIRAQMRTKVKDKTEVEAGLETGSLFRASYHFAQILFLWFQKEVMREIPRMLKEYLSFNWINLICLISLQHTY